jgi:hypothetical protein
MSLALPFKTLPKQSTETVDIGDETCGILPVPKHGCLTVNEELAIAGYFADVAPEVSMASVKVEVASILLQSRFDAAWTVEAIRKKIKHFELIEKLYEFTLNERSHWQKAQPVAESDEAEETSKNDQ